MKPKETEVSPREWEILKCSDNGDRFIHGPDTGDNEFVKVREVTAPHSSDSERLRLAVLSILNNHALGPQVALIQIREAIGPLDGSSK